MTRHDYLQALEHALGFMERRARDEVLSDMEELYDGLGERGLDDAAVQKRMGTPGQVAREYRLMDQLDRMARAPGATSGVRMGILTLSGRLARGLAVQLVGLVWLALALMLVAAAISVAAGLGLAALEAVGYVPVVSTLAVPGIPVISGVLIGVATALGAFAILLAIRLLMRTLARVMRSRLRASADDRLRYDGPDPTEASNEDRRWIDSGRAVWHASSAALLLAVIAAILFPVVPAPNFPVMVEEQHEVSLLGISELVIEANRVHLVFAEPSPDARAVRLELSGEMKRTFGQQFALEATEDNGRAVVTAFHREGLSWGINPYPSLAIIMPADLSIPVTIRIQEADIDDAALPPEVRALVGKTRAE